jgi:hypothetical protein
MLAINHGICPSHEAIPARFAGIRTTIGVSLRALLEDMIIDSENVRTWQHDRRKIGPSAEDEL